MSKVKTIHIGKKDIYSWTMGEGKTMLMPLLLEGSRKLITDDLDEVKSVRIEAVIRGKEQAFDFYVKRDEISDTLSKILEWALEEEEYEICNEIKNLENRLEHF